MPVSVEEIHAELDKRAEPYVQRINELEKSLENKDGDIMILKHALDNLERIIDEGKKTIKRTTKK